MKGLKRYSVLALTGLLMACGNDHNNAQDDRIDAASRAMTELASEENEASHLMASDAIEASAASVENTMVYTDWTPVFASWANGCQNSKIFETLEDKLVRFNDNPQSDNDAKPKLGKVVLPVAYQQATGKVKIVDKGDHSIFVIPLHNSQFKGLDLASIQVYRGHENGIFGTALVFGDSLKAKDMNVIKLLPSKEIWEITGEPQKAFWETDYDGKVALICDWST